jgi:signal transduction histidine kinase
MNISTGIGIGIGAATAAGGRAAPAGLAPEPESPARILIVDDEVAHVKALSEVLRGPRYEPIGCTSGQAALAVLAASPCAVLMTDLMMPGMDGITLLREAHRLDPDLVGIIMTGQGTIETAVDAMKSGAQDYILKPLQLGIVLPVLARALATRRLRIENRELIVRLSERTRELELANQELEAFTYSVSHDLRGPLRAIFGFTTILELDHGPELAGDARELLERVSSSARRMDGIIDDLLRLSQLGREPLQKQQVDVRALALSVLEQVQSAGSPHCPEVNVGELPSADADAALLAHVFTNLLSNAFKFTRQTPLPRIEVGSHPAEPAPVYFVRDNGVGFNMQQAERLFGPFQRLHTQQAFEGTGIGLSIVKRIVERHGGRAWAESEVGKGACFYFTLAG